MNVFMGTLLSFTNIKITNQDKFLLALKTTT